MASAQDLATRLGKYYYLVEKNNAKLRLLPCNEVTVAYDALIKEWHFPNPPKEDGEERRKYFAKCEEICNSTASTVEELLLVFFVAWAAVCVISDHELIEYSEAERGRIMGAGNDYCMAKLGFSTDLPRNLQTALFPDHVNSVTTNADLLGKTIRYRDSVTGNVQECKIQDFGTSKMRGSWYMITDKDDDNELMITAKEMDDILAVRVL